MAVVVSCFLVFTVVILLYLVLFSKVLFDEKQLNDLIAYMMLIALYDHVNIYPLHSTFQNNGGGVCRLYCLYIHSSLYTD